MKLMKTRLTLKGHTSANLHRQNFQIAGVFQVDATESSLHHDNSFYTPNNRAVVQLASVGYCWPNQNNVNLRLVRIRTCVTLVCVTLFFIWKDSITP